MNLLISILIPNLFGFIGGLLGNSSMEYSSFSKPFFSPPGIVFPIVWVILYTLMGISFYIILKSNDKDKDSSIIIYFFQLIINSLWTLFFFRFKWYLFSFIWILILIGFVIVMIYKFYKINKVAGLIQIPYLLWLLFASILNFSIYLMN